MSAVYDRKIRLQVLRTDLSENCNKSGDHLQIYSEITCAELAQFVNKTYKLVDLSGRPFPPCGRADLYFLR